MNDVSTLLRWPLALLGAVLFVTGMITFWLPIPIGLPLMLIGMPLLVRYSPLARFGFMRLARRYPRVRKFIFHQRPPRSK